MQKKLLESDPVTDGDMQRLWKACVLKYQESGRLQKIVRVAERTICEKREYIDFQGKENSASLKKWERYGHDPVIFRKFPAFAQFLFDSNLLSQMKVTRDEIQILENEPYLLVEGEWMKWDALLETFEFQKSDRFKETFVLRKEDKEVYTYLDNGKGLQLHHPYLTKKLTPISTLSEQEYNKLHAVAQKFKFEEPTKSAENRPFILQIVSSRVQGPDTNAHNFLLNRKHPYIRVIVGEDNPDLGIKKGDVFEVGYGWKTMPLVPFIATTGQFRSPDVWEYMPCEERVVTNIPVSKEDAHELMQYTQSFHNESINLGRDIGFHLGRQNCSVYVRNAAKKAGVTVPTEISLSNVIRKVCPEWIKTIGRAYEKAKGEASKLTNRVAQILPEWLVNGSRAINNAVHRVAKKIAEITIAFVLNPLRALLGAGLGKQARNLDPDREDVKPSLWNPRNFFDLSSYNMNLPGVLQEWQLEQASTKVFSKPVKLAII